MFVNIFEAIIIVFILIFAFILSIFGISFDGSRECRQSITSDEAFKVAKHIGILDKTADEWKAPFTLASFTAGMNVELEHGTCIDGHESMETNVTNNDLKKTGKIAWAHLKETPDYYEKLASLGL